MSHEVHVVNGKAQAIYNTLHGLPWWVGIDGLEGFGVEGGIVTVEQVESCIPLGVVVKRPMYVQTANGLFEVPNQFVTTREVEPHFDIDGVSDARSDVLAPVGGTYGTVQDQDTVRIALASGRPISCFVLLDGGRRSVASVALDDIVVDPNGIADRMNRHLNVFNSHDGSRNLMAAEGTVRVVCANTEQMALGQGGTIHKLRHSSKVEDRLDMMASIVADATNAGALIVAQAEQMLRVDGGKALDAVLDTLAPIPTEGTDRIKTRRKNLRDQIVDVARGPLSMDMVGWNGWAVYNGVTEFIDHHRTVRGASNDARARIGQALDPLAPAQQDKVKAAEAILALV